MKTIYNNCIKLKLLQTNATIILKRELGYLPEFGKDSIVKDLKGLFAINFFPKRNKTAKLTILSIISRNLDFLLKKLVSLYAHAHYYECFHLTFPPSF